MYGILWISYTHTSYDIQRISYFIRCTSYDARVTTHDSYRTCDARRALYDKSTVPTALGNVLDFHSLLFGHEPQNVENCEPGKYRGTAVRHREYHGVSAGRGQGRGHGCGLGLVFRTLKILPNLLDTIIRPRENHVSSDRGYVQGVVRAWSRVWLQHRILSRLSADRGA